MNEEKTRLVDLTKGESFGFLGFDMRRTKTLSGKWGVHITLRMKARTKLLRNLKEIFRRGDLCRRPAQRVIELINTKLRGWVNYFRIGHSSRCFQYVRDWAEKKVRRHLMRVRKRKGFGWDRWSKDWLYQSLGLYAVYKVRYHGIESTASR